MKLHPRFPELILAFKQDPDAYDNFVVMVSFFSEWLHICGNLYLYIDGRGIW